jgi:hypothetical protein
LPAIFWVKRTSSIARFQGSTAGRCDTRPSSRLRRASAAVSAPIRTSPSTARRGRRRCAAGWSCRSPRVRPGR